MRDKLIELISMGCPGVLGGTIVIEGEGAIKSITLNAEKFADYLIANGVTISEEKPVLHESDLCSHY